MPKYLINKHQLRKWIDRSENTINKIITTGSSTISLIFCLCYKLQSI